MKKSIFIAISAISVLAVGLFLTACSPKSSSLNPNEDAMLVEPTQQEQETSAEEWETFYAAVEDLNAKYLPENDFVCYALASDSTDDTKELKKNIIIADIAGALEGARFGDAIGGMAGAIICGVVTGVLESYKEYENTQAQAIVSTRALKTITNITSTTAGAIVGQQHNIMVDNLKSNQISLKNMTNRQAKNLLINKYETLFFAIDSDIKSALLGGSSVRVPSLSSNVQQANQNFQQTTANLSIANLHSYTTDYLAIVDSSISNAQDKLYMSAYASQTYYSTALWIVQ